MDDLYQSYYGARYHDIVLCSIVDEVTYKSTKPKIVFILREAHPAYGGWSIPCELNRIISKYHRDGEPLNRAFMATWRQTGVWAYSIIYGFDNYTNLNEDWFVAKGLQAIGMTNLKKTGGGPTPSLGEISTFASKEKDLWQREIEIMNPDLLICGGTYSDVQENLGLPKYELAKISGQPHYYSVHEAQYREHGHVILDFWHPAIRKSRDDILRHLETLINELRAKGAYYNRKLCAKNLPVKGLAQEAIMCR